MAERESQQPNSWSFLNDRTPKTFNVRLVTGPVETAEEIRERLFKPVKKHGQTNDGMERGKPNHQPRVEENLVTVWDNEDAAKDDDDDWVWVHDDDVLPPNHRHTTTTSSSNNTATPKTTTNSSRTFTSTSISSSTTTKSKGS